MEYDILVSMDRIFCEETNKELQSVKSKGIEKQQKELEVARKRK